MLKPCPCGVAEVERQVLYDEEVIRRSPGVVVESVVLEPYTWVSVPVLLGYVGWITEA
jgi:hypothetical protein